jgi:hypothetical protein
MCGSDVYLRYTYRVTPAWTRAACLAAREFAVRFRKAQARNLDAVLAPYRLHVNAADVLVRRGIDRDGSR